MCVYIYIYSYRHIYIYIYNNNNNNNNNNSNLAVGGEPTVDGRTIRPRSPESRVRNALG